MSQLQKLKPATEALFKKERRAVQNILAEEARLREQLAKLDVQRRTLQAEPGDLREMRAIGADVVWLGWMGKKRTELNLKLAQVLARKAHLIGRVKRAFGKTLAVERLMDQKTREQKRDHSRALMEKYIDASLNGDRRL